jgi:hypothetical protein
MLQACLSENLYTTQRSLESNSKVVGTINSYGPFIDRANPLSVKQLDNKVGSLLKTFEARYTSEKANLSAIGWSTIDRCLYDISQGKKKRKAEVADKKQAKSKKEMKNVALEEQHVFTLES